MHSKKKKILILGSSSYIAKNFIKKIGSHEIIKVARNSKESDKVIIAKKYSQIFFNKLLRKYRPKKIVNFIGIAKTKRKKENNFNFFFKVNCEISINLLEAIRNIPDYNPKIILIGSAAEYGASQEIKNYVFSEKSVTNPKSFYGITKNIQTNIALFYAKNFNINVDVIRFSNIIGTNMQPGFIISDIINKIKNNQGIVRLGDLSSIRDFIDINDATEGLKRILNYKSRGEIINISSGKGTAIKEITDIISDLVNNISFEEKNSNEFVRSYSVLSNSKLRTLTKFSPKKNIKKIIKKIITTELLTYKFNR